jgi:hypothetical protein
VSFPRTVKLALLVRPRTVKLALLVRPRTVKLALLVRPCTVKLALLVRTRKIVSIHGGSLLLFNFFHLTKILCCGDAAWFRCHAAVVMQPGLDVMLLW